MNSGKRTSLTDLQELQDEHTLMEMCWEESGHSDDDDVEEIEYRFDNITLGQSAVVDELRKPLKRNNICEAADSTRRAGSGLGARCWEKEADIWLDKVSMDRLRFCENEEELEH